MTRTLTASGRMGALGVLAILLGVIVTALPAHAISRYTSTAMSCPQIYSVIGAEGEVVLRWVQPPDIQRFDRFVANRSFCGPTETTVPFTVPAAGNTACTVYRCGHCERDPDDLFSFFSCR